MVRFFTERMFSTALWMFHRTYVLHCALGAWHETFQPERWQVVSQKLTLRDFVVHFLLNCPLTVLCVCIVGCVSWRWSVRMRIFIVAREWYEYFYDYSWQNESDKADVSRPDLQQWRLPCLFCETVCRFNANRYWAQKRLVQFGFTTLTSSSHFFNRWQQSSFSWGPCVFGKSSSILTLGWRAISYFSICSSVCGRRNGGVVFLGVRIAYPPMSGFRSQGRVRYFRIVLAWFEPLAISPQDG